MRRSRRDGFTLVELMVALSVFIVMAMAVGGLLFATTSVSENDAEFTTSMADLEAVMEAINGTPFDAIVATYPNGQAVPAFNGLHLNDEIVRVAYAVPSVDTDGDGDKDGDDLDEDDDGDVDDGEMDCDDDGDVDDDDLDKDGDGDVDAADLSQGPLQVRITATWTGYNGNVKSQSLFGVRVR